METVDVCVELENDEFFSKFLRGDASPAATAEAEGAPSVTEQVERLLAGVDKLNAHLERQVLLKHTDLLTQASHVTDLEAELGQVQLQARDLLRGTDRLRAHVTSQHDALERQTRALDAALSTCHLLRHAARILALRGKLPALRDEPHKRAVVLFQIEELLADYDLDDVDLLADAVSDVRREKEQLLQNSARQLQESLLAGDKPRLLAAFKVLHNLQQMQQQVDSTVSDTLRAVQRAAVLALSVQAPQTEHNKSSRSGPGRANVMNATEFKQRLWDNLDKLFKNEVAAACSKMVMLQTVLDELHAIGDFRNIACKFWDDFCLMFAAELDSSSVTVNQCVEIDFPLLLKCFNDLLASLKSKRLTLKREILVKWENAFLSKSLGRLLEPVRGMWHSGPVPTQEQMDDAVRVISSALSVSLGDRQLSASLAASVAKCIKQMHVEVEQRVAMDNEAAQIIEAPTSSQLRNAELCNALHYFTSQVSRTLANMKAALLPESAAVVRESLGGASSLPVLQSLATSINNSLELILMTMHQEPDMSRAEDGRPASCSAYMRELQQFVSRCRDIYLSMFADRAAIDECCSTIARRCIHRFVQHVCVIRPLTAYGRLKLQLDCKHLDVALSPLISDVTSLGETYRQLKAIYILLEKTPSQIAKSQAEGACVPYSYVVMFLFGWAGPQLVSPSACAGWSVPQLLQWLDSHAAERDRLEFVAGALQRYQTHVRQHNIATYDEIFPIMLQLLDEGRKQLQ